MNLGSRYSQHSFAVVPQANIARSSFDRSFTVKDTFNFDRLVPCFVDEVLPGDTINMNLKAFIRLAPQVVPAMDNAYVDFFFFFVPNRLTWENWERFNGAQDDPGDTTDYLIPQIVAPAITGFTNGGLADHFGLPTGVVGISVNALPFRAYNLIWNEWFRDQNIENSVTVSIGNGPDSISNYSLLSFNSKHDYFTSALPFPQKGNAVELPLGSEAPIIGIGLPNATVSGTVSPSQSVRVSGETSPSTLTGWYIEGNGGSFGAGEAGLFVEQGNTGYPDIRADLSEATAATINQFREAIMLQSILELDARGGTRYTEILKAHFNVISPDFRLQRPEFLGAGTIMINQHPVPQTSQTTEDSPQANLAAFSTASSLGSNIGFSKSFVEHGYVIGIMRARGEVSYQQGINRMWSRNTRFDFFWPKLQMLGEQAILNKELVAMGTDPLSDDDGVFAYQERYAEYRYRPSEIKGQFRSNFAESLDIWHYAREFDVSEGPVEFDYIFLNQTTPIERNLVNLGGDYPDLIFDGYFEYKHARPIMTYGVPASLGRF